MIELCEATEDNPFIHGMSKSFVKALQQLFNVMDSEQTNTIRFHDLANQWEDDESDPFFPKGLINCLAKVQLPNGLLTFDRFCAGIKLCLLKNQVDIKDLQLNESINHTSSVPNNDPVPIGVPIVTSPSSNRRSDSVSNDRPPSEPKIHAPPPPPSLLKNEAINNHGKSLNCNQTRPTSPTSSTLNGSSIISITNDDSYTSSSTTSTKKMPLPSYEQVMANKLKKSSSPSALLNQRETSSLSTAANNISANTVLSDFEQTVNGRATMLPPVKPPLSRQIDNENIDSQNFSFNHPFQQDQSSNNGLFVQTLPSFSSSYGSNGNRISYDQNHYRLSNKNNCRAKSMPQLDCVESNPSRLHYFPSYSTSEQSQNNNSILVGNSIDNEIIIQNANSQPAIQRSIVVNDGQMTSSSSSTSRPLNQSFSHPKTVSRNCILKTLQSWRDNILNKQNNDTIKDFRAEPLIINNIFNNDAEIDNQNFYDLTSRSKIDELQTKPMLSNSFRRNSFRRREPRRHTVGVNNRDLYSVKRFQQLEQEKDILLRGLNELDKTREWYIRHISSIQDKINFAGRCGGTFPSDCNIDAYQERINFQAIRIQTLNQHLITLRDSGQSFPIHMNLAIRPLNGLMRIDPNQPKQLVVNPNLVNKLKEQNRLLTDEVTRKSELITQLEMEKSSLIRELFQARTYGSYYGTGQCFDDTFM
ncbi:von Willebrand factor C and EGF domain-containing protein [Sarcoptes scabiei]|nr:von Willebrand factor C and EGF domain-containing protein [Sarcoptes scabiei]